MRYDKTNRTSKHGQHGKPAAPKLHCPSEYYRFQLVMDFGCPGVGGGEVVWYNKTNMTSLWGCQHESLHLVSIVTLGLRPRMTMLTWGRQSCWQPHRDVIFV